jgi:formylglycine-generating enzyme required for sulfatase activity
MLRIFAACRAIGACTVATALGSAAWAIEFETVLVGNAGNASDVRTMNDATCCYGAVAYEYRIGKYEVTNDQYAAFLNAIASNGDTYENYEPFQMGGAHYGGILRSGSPGSGGYVYTVKPNMGDKPVGGVSNGAARRFVNWLHNGQPTGNQVPGTTETGAYDLTGSNWMVRSSGANWFLPSENEWYKAAYHFPTAGVPGNYALYATGSSFTPPTFATADAVGNVANPGVNVATYLAGANWNGSAPFGHVTTVGSAGPLSASYYGTFDQSGNASEWTEDVSIRGGHFGSSQDQLSAEVRFGNASLGYAGLRVASVLNPSEPPVPGLQAYWNAENGATDVTGNGHDGSFFGDAATITAGPFGKAFSLDGAGDYISIGDELDMGASDFTLSAWINGDPFMNQWGRIFDKGYASGYSLHRRGFDNHIGFEMQNSGNFFGTETPLIDGAWHHVALVKSGVSVKIYADGVAENTHTVSGASQNNSLPLLIGFNPGEGIMGFWKGLLDELRIYDRALAPAEIAVLAVNPLDDPSGDFDQDGDVDGADLLVWQRGGSPTPNSPGDLAAWRGDFGLGAATAAAAAVPEPASLAGTATALALLARRRRCSAA